MDIFLEISLILTVATVVAGIMQLLRQPLIIGHIISGLLVGPAVLNLVHSTEAVELFSQIGIALLLFIIGLGLNPKVVKEVGKVAIFTGLGQILFTSVSGFFIASVLGFSLVPALFIAAGLSFSSTIIILKLLSDKKDTHRLYGKVSTGFLLVQDVVAVLILVAVTALGSGEPLAQVLSKTFGIGVIFVLALIVISRFVLPRLVSFFARSQEFLFLFAIGWGLGIAALAQVVGFSIEIGALAAGVALATSPYAFEISSRMRPLRDFFIVVFFIVLGSELEFSSLAASLLPAITFSILVLIGNPIVVMAITGFFRFTRKTSFKCGLAVAQISEFSLILLLLGRDLGQISPEIVAVVTLVAMITIAASTYMILYADNLYDSLEPYLRIFERSSLREDTDSSEEYDAILIGLKSGSRSFIEGFKRLKKSYLVVDYDPEVVDLLSKESVPVLYGDGNDTEFLAEIPLEKAQIVVINVTDFATNMLIVDQVTQRNSDVLIIAKAEEAHQARDLYDSGANYVMMPHFLGSLEMTRRFLRYGLQSQEHFSRAKSQHLAYLNRSHK